MISFLEIEKTENLINHNIHFDDLLEFQSSLIEELSKKIFGTILSLNELTNMREPMKNIFLVDLFESVSYSGILLHEIKNMKNYQKIKKLVDEISPIMKILI